VVSDDTDALQGPCTSSDCRTTLTTAAGELVVYRSHALGAINPSVTLAVIVVHGVSRNASGYFGYVVEAANDVGAMDATAVIAPLFQEAAAGAEELYWEDGSGWQEGGDGTSSLGSAFSSYAAVDDLLERLANKTNFPNLARIVVTGHSAGGQLTQRYAAGMLSSAGCLPIRYVVANPSSYLHLNGNRLVDGTWTSSANVLDDCQGYDDYKYGLENREEVPYMANQTAEALIERYVSSEVVYLLGTADTCNEDLDSSCNDSTLDKSCPAMIQGDHRLQRGDRFYAFMNEYFAGHPHEQRHIDGVGHSGNGVYDSDEAKEVIFLGP
jgi:hypothetical protein